LVSQEMAETQRSNLRAQEDIIRVGAVEPLHQSRVMVDHQITNLVEPGRPQTILAEAVAHHLALVETAAQDKLEHLVRQEHCAAQVEAEELATLPQRVLVELVAVAQPDTFLYHGNLTLRPLGRISPSTGGNLIYSILIMAVHFSLKHSSERL